MKVFIPINEQNESLFDQCFEIKPLVIEAYKYHLASENTQNLDIKKVTIGTETNNRGNTKVV